MPDFSITDLAKIIERDSKDATYKFALLRDLKFSEASWMNDSYSNLMAMSKHLINERGFAPWGI